MDSYDRWKTTPPDEPESNFTCECCGDFFLPDDKVYDIEGEEMCEECAKEWLERQVHLATEDECYGDDEY